MERELEMDAEKLSLRCAPLMDYAEAKAVYDTNDKTVMDRFKNVNKHNADLLREVDDNARELRRELMSR